ncbi:uncharacterized protein LOC142165172 [Nicotiana tabacum]|uniref:Uncharacterized protein LOC142165172 n=2 Tax=Nicotiana TaxID=4085 RepID=A0AC58S4H8_TOBAC|nr:PREDICTED: uncharacterized protein LOC104226527 [Nicotiana sylvestris]
MKGKNYVDILVDRELRESVIEVRWVNNRLMAIKLVVGEITLNIISAYAYQVGLDEVVGGILPTEKLFIERDFNRRIGSSVGGYEEVHGGFDFGVRNGGGTSLLDFSKAFELMIAKSSCPKRDGHLVTF